MLRKIIALIALLSSSFSLEGCVVGEGCSVGDADVVSKNYQDWVKNTDGEAHAYTFKCEGDVMSLKNPDGSIPVKSGFIDLVMKDVYSGFFSPTNFEAARGLALQIAKKKFIEMLKSQNPLIKDVQSVICEEKFKLEPPTPKCPVSQNDSDKGGTSGDMLPPPVDPGPGPGSGDSPDQE
jgi:hypothetical protein